MKIGHLFRVGVVFIFMRTRLSRWGFLFLCVVGIYGTPPAKGDVVIDPSSWTLYLSNPASSDPSITNYLFQYLPDPYVGQYYRLSISSRTPPSFSGGVSFSVPGRLAGSGQNIFNFAANSTGPYTLSTSLQFSISASDPSAILCYTQVNGVISFPVIQEGVTVITVPGVSTSTAGYQQIACQNNSFSDIAIGISQIALISAPSPSPTPSASPSPTPSPSPVSSQKILIFDDSGAQIVENSTIPIAPSVYSGLCTGIPADTPQIKDFAILCVDATSGQPVSGCRYTITLKKGAENGGHDHDLASAASRPLGLVTPELATVSPQPISSQGSAFSYEATDIAQDVDFTINGVGPDGSSIPAQKGKFRVKDPAANDFHPISVAGLDMNVASHPTGIYGRTSFNSKLEKMVDLYFGSTEIPNTIADIESQGASLPFGGLFDTKQDWLNPHCGHRDGKTIDISVNTASTNIHLTSREKTALDKAIRFSGLIFYVPEESPTNRNADHWHVQLQR